MSTNQERNASLPIRRNLTLIYALSFIIAILMAAASVAGLMYRTITLEQIAREIAESTQ